MPSRDSAARIGIVIPCNPPHTSAVHAARTSASTAVANAQLPEETREETGKRHDALPGGARGKFAGIACATWNRPSWQCGQFRHSIPATRRMNASTDSSTTGSGTGASSASRAAARLAALRANPSKP